MATETLELKITGNSKEAQDAINKTNKALGDLSNQKPKQQSFLQSLKSNWMLVAGGVMAAYQALKTVVDVMSKVIMAAAEAEDVENQLASAMSKVGMYTEETLKKQLNYSQALSQVSKYTDEEISLLQAQYIRLGIHGEQLEKLTQATLDYATVTGYDLKNAGDQVARSFLNGSENLGRMNLSIKGTAGSTEYLTSLTQKMTGMWGGAAAQSVETLSGKLNMTKKNIGDIGEAIGIKAIPAIKILTDDFNSFLSPSSDAVKVLAEGFKWLSVGIVALSDGVSLVLTPIVLTIKNIGLSFWRLTQLIVQNVALIGNAFKDFGSFLKNPQEKTVELLSNMGGTFKKFISDWNNDSLILAESTVGAMKKLVSDVTKAASDNGRIITKNTQDDANEIIAISENMYGELDQHIKDFRKVQEAELEKKRQDAENEKQIKEELYNSVLQLQRFMFAEGATMRAQELSDGLSKISMLRDAELADMESRREAEIANDTLTEEEKAAINEKYKVSRETSDANYAAKEKALKSQKWEEDKAWAIAQSIIDTAVATGKALATFPAPNFALAAIAGGAGLVQTGIIAARANPFNAADGGIIQEPIHGVGASGRQYTFGENGSEVISPVNNYGGASIVIQNMTINSKNSADNFILQLEKRTGSKLFRR